MITSTRVQKNLGILRIKTGLTPNIFLRFAFCMSLKDPSIPNPDEHNQDGSELTPAVLFGEHEPIYLALMLNRLKKDKLDPEIYLHKMTARLLISKRRRQQARSRQCPRGRTAKAHSWKVAPIPSTEKRSISPAQARPAHAAALSGSG